MSKLVVIFGAGASADFGVPTLGQLFKDHQARLYLSQNAWLHKHLEDIFWGPRGHTLSTSDASLTVEEMLTILRDWEKEASPRCMLSPDELGRFRKDIYCLIYRALFEGKSTRGEHLNKLLEFARTNFQQTTWASFNWDCIFESSFWYSSGSYEPGSRSNPELAVSISNWRNGSSKHSYLKLHGSINWWLDSNRLQYYRFSSSGDLSAKWHQYSQDPAPTSHPVILEPSYYKYEDAVYKLLEPQWARFLERLVAADFVLVVGYSMPPADAQARSKMLTAFQANPNSHWGVIDPNPETIARYRRIFGERRLQAFIGGVVGFNNDFPANFAQLFPTFAATTTTRV